MNNNNEEIEEKNIGIKINDNDDNINNKINDNQKE